jgi:hypothetical protein
LTWQNQSCQTCFLHVKNNYNLFLSENLALLALSHDCLVVGPEEDAVIRLSNHFQTEIDSILAHTFRHYSVPKKKRGKGPCLFVYEQLEEKKGFNKNPISFLLQPSSLQVRLKDCREKIIQSLRKFQFEKYNQSIAQCFGDAVVLDQGSGIDALFPPRSAGRPKKLRLAAFQDNKASETTLLVDILGQAIDIATKERFVLVQWADSKDDEMTWTPIRLLSPVTQTWWSSESDRRFPHIDLTKEAPLLRLSGGPVTVIFEEDSEDLA